MDIDLRSKDSIPYISTANNRIVFNYKKDEKKFNISRKFGSECNYEQAKLGVIFRGYKWMIDNNLLSNLTLNELNECVTDLFKK